MTHCAISTFDNTLEEVCVIMSGNKDEKKQKNYKKLSGMTLPQRDNRRLDGA